MPRQTRPDQTMKIDLITFIEEHGFRALPVGARIMIAIPATYYPEPYKESRVDITALVMADATLGSVKRALGY